MRKEISSAVFIGVIAVAVVVVVGLWLWQPWQPKIYGLEPPTAIDRKQHAEQMRKDMMEAMRQRQRAGTPR